MLNYLEGQNAINWQTTVVWQARPLSTVQTTAGTGGSQRLGGEGREEEWVGVDHLASKLEEGYHSGPSQTLLSSGFNTFQVDYAHKRLVNQHTGRLFELRRLAFAPLMPMKVGQLHKRLLSVHWHLFSFFFCRLKMMVSLSTTLHLLVSGVFTIELLFSVRQSALHCVMSRLSFSSTTDGVSTQQRSARRPFSNLLRRYCAC